MRNIIDTAKSNARVAGSVRATASVSHPRTADGDLIVAEQVTVSRTAEAGAEFEVGAVLTTVLNPEAPDQVDVFAQGEKVAELARESNGTWTARASFTGEALTRPGTVEAAWEAIVRLFGEPDSDVDTREAEREREVTTAWLRQEQADALEAAEQAVKRAHAASARLRDEVRVDGHLFRETFVLRHQVNDLLLKVAEQG